MRPGVCFPCPSSLTEAFAVSVGALNFYFTCATPTTLHLRKHVLTLALLNVRTRTSALSASPPQHRYSETAGLEATERRQKPQAGRPQDKVEQNKQAMQEGVAVSDAQTLAARMSQGYTSHKPRVRAGL